MNKKAQSMIITTILIILLVMVSIVVLWNVVFFFVSEAEEEIGLDSFLLMGEVEFSVMDSANAKVVVEREIGGGEIEGVKLIFKDSVGKSYVYDSDEYPDELETEVYDIGASDVEGLSDFSDVESVSVHFIYGKGRVTPSLDED